jgi:putative oxidoreductase
MSATHAALARLAPLPLRLIVGYGFFEHGWLKLGRGVEVFAAALAGLGLPAPDLLAWLTVAVELIGGLAVLLGAYLAWASIPMIIVLLVALVTVHLPFGFSSIKFLAVTADGPQFGKPGIECDLLYLAAFATLLTAGPGPFAIDGWRRRRAVAAMRQVAPPAQAGARLAVTQRGGNRHA